MIDFIDLFLTLFFAIAFLFLLEIIEKCFGLLFRKEKRNDQ